MKRISLSLSLFCALALVACPPLFAQAPPPTPQEQVALLIKDLQAQQAAMNENQAKIEEKLTALAEAVRVARIYASRGGR